MRSNVKMVGVIAGITAFTLAACGEQPKPATPESTAKVGLPPKAGGGLKIDVAKGHPPDGNNQDCKNAKGRLWAIVIDISNVASPITATRELYLTDLTGDHPDGPRIAVLDPMANASTGADVDAGPFLPNKKDVVLLQLKLPNGVEFAKGKDTILTEDATNGKMFCVKTAIDVPTGAQTVSFYVHNMEGINPAPLIGAYTFYLKDMAGHIVRIGVDPEVENHGIN